MDFSSGKKKKKYPNEMGMRYPIRRRWLAVPVIERRAIEKNSERG